MMKSPHSVQKKTHYIPLVRALAWIIGSTFVINAAAYNGLKFYYKNLRTKTQDTRYAISSIVQTGPQKEALKTDYLSELIGLSVDRPVSSHMFDVKRAERCLLTSPLIKEAVVKTVPPTGLYIDYTVRQPIAWVYDFENIAIDREGYLFPVRPFLTPKVLPEIYFGSAPFGQTPSNPESPTAFWGRPMQGESVEIAMSLLKILTDPRVSDLINVRRIDISDAFHESYGQRQIVITVEDECILSQAGRTVLFILPRLLRLTTKNYAQELGNYLKLRQELLQQERTLLKFPEANVEQVRLESKVIDFRISGLAYVDEPEKDKFSPNSSLRASP